MTSEYLGLGSGIDAIPGSVSRGGGEFYNALVPKARGKVINQKEWREGLFENLEYRRRTLEAARRDKDFQEEQIVMCMRDPHYWVNTFVWLFEPQAKPPHYPPFVTYEYQDSVLASLHNSIGWTDLVWPKSRELGATWIVATDFLHYWLFTANSHLAVLSKTQDDADKHGDPSTTMGKMDVVLAHLPTWMAPILRPKLHRTFCSLRNPINGSLIKGDATTADALRSGRFLAALLDEFGFIDPSKQDEIHTGTADVCPCRVFLSTPNGCSNTFASLANDRLTPQIRTMWYMHPEKSPGRYVASSTGELVVIDPCRKFEVVRRRVPNYESRDGTIKPWPDRLLGFPEDYNFILDGIERSPFLDYKDRQLSRIPQKLAQEHLCDFKVSANYVFDHNMLDRYASEVCDVRPHAWRGWLKIDEDAFTIIASESRSNGEFFSWIPFSEAVSPPPGKDYVMGVDVAKGRGSSSSNSVIAVYDRATAEKVFEFASCSTYSELGLADLAETLRRYFNDAYVIWDGAGPGLQFGERIRMNGCNRFYFDRNEKVARSRRSKTPGYFGKGPVRAKLFLEYAEAMEKRWISNFSRYAIDDCRPWVHGRDGAIEHEGAVSTDEVTSSKANHGDRCVADALVWKIIRSETRRAVKDDAEASAAAIRTPPPNCYAARRAEFERERRRKTPGWGGVSATGHRLIGWF